MKDITIRYVRFVLLTGFCLSLFGRIHQSQAQESERNFGEITEAKQAYYDSLAAEGHSLKGIGYKPFKRWEYYWGKRIAPEAKFSEVNRMLSEQQELNKSLRSGEDCLGNWSLAGPNTFPSISSSSGGIGRLNRVVPHPDFNGEGNRTVFATNNGGLWRTEDLGNFWENLTENSEDVLDRASITDVVINPHNDREMYVSTGVKYRTNGGLTGNEFLYPDYTSTGVFKTTDGGNSWEATGLGFTIHNRKIISELHMDPQNPERLFAVVYSFIHWDNNQATWGSLYRSEDAGGSWELIFKGPAWDMEFKPEQPDVFYLAGMNNLLRFSNSGGSPSAALDCASNPDCEDLTPDLTAAGMNPFHLGGLSHVEGLKIAVTPANPDKLYVLQVRSAGDSLNPFDPNGGTYGKGFGGIFVSDDAGNSFAPITTADAGLRINQINGAPSISSDSQVVTGDYRTSIAVTMDRSTFVADPEDERKIHMAGLNYGFSEDEGESFSVVPSNAIANHLHVDVRDVAVARGNPNYVFVVEDASFSYSSNGGQTFTRPECNNLSIGMIYRLGISPTANASITQKLLVGLLDVTTMVYDYQSWVQPPGVGGDGMEALFDPNNPQVAYRMLQNGRIDRSTNGGQSFLSFVFQYGGAWVTPMVMDGNSTLFVAKQEVSRKLSTSNSFGTISNFASIGQSGKTLNVLRVAPSTSDVIYAGYWLGRKLAGNIYSSSYESDKQLFRTVNGGLSWTDITPTGTAGKGNGGLLMDIAIDPDDPDRIWTVFSGYKTDNPSSGFGKRRVMHSEDGGQSWIAYSDGLPDSPVNTIRYDPNTQADELYIGTEIGVYYRNRHMENWECFGSGLPLVPVEELEINPKSKEIFAGTWGRGVWQSSLRCAADFNLTLNGTVNGGQYSEAQNTITSTQVINSSASVGYRGGSAIYLKNGFRAYPGSDFEAYLYTCVPFSTPRLAQEEFEGEEAEEDFSEADKVLGERVGDNLLALPNPFSEETRLIFPWNQEEKGSIQLMDINGRVVRQLGPEVQMREDGKGEVLLASQGLAAGVYLCIWQQGGQQKSLKLVIQGK